MQSGLSSREAQQIKNKAASGRNSGRRFFMIATEAQQPQLNA